MDDSKLTVNLNDPADIQRAMTTLGEVMLGHVNRLAQGIPLPPPAPAPADRKISLYDVQTFAQSNGYSRPLATLAYRAVRDFYARERGNWEYELMLSDIEEIASRPLQYWCIPTFGAKSHGLLRAFVADQKPSGDGWG